MVTKKEVSKIASLAKLEINDDQIESMQIHFEKLIDQFSCLQNVDTSGVEPMLTPHDIPVLLREDVVTKTISKEELLENAPETKDFLFQVPPVV